ncbi:GNAT family N-acetyltransferase [Nonomuraea endophytica]|uniref:GNAT family N-acetyltransferase n=1 Tax=Nonomuraea endophytica TaxID=714136 RepID=UPI0037C76605
MNVRRAGAHEAEAVAELIATAFAELKVVRYLVPEPERRQEVMAANFRIFVEHAAEHGMIDLVEDAPAVAVWLPWTAPEPPDYDRRLREAAGDAIERFRELDEQFGKHHPHEPHHHLAFLAVHPGHQGRGLGSALLEHHHAALGTTPAYLEASSPRARDLYARHGYEVRQPFAMRDGTLFWPMWRPAP